MAASWPHAATDTIFQRIIIMDMNWADTLSSLVKRVGVFAKANPPVASAFHKLETATRETGVLDAKTHELISLAVAVTTRCDGCIAAHAGAARKAGASRKKWPLPLAPRSRSTPVPPMSIPRGRWTPMRHSDVTS
jgi:AhpD family alkylhydroperoxidase